SGEAHAVSSVTVNGRPEQEGAEQSLGLYLNSLPLAVSLKPGSWSELLTRMNSVYREGMAHRRHPLSIIQQSLDKDFGEVSFNYTHFHAFDTVSQSIEDQGIDVLGISGFEQTSYGLVVFASRVNQDQMELIFGYDESLYSAAFIEHLGEMYVRVYQSLLADLAASHQSRSLLPEY
ncbi:condensation domain-containing protein, partial [Pseudoalteromonas sp. P1-9]|uniref:condensation domain-containing protein n=1 Tax=Pseudoalteromonas sp. P1-9 TaxID=1710354 RepID=UPI000AD7F932